MSKEAAQAVVANDEMLARYVFYSKWIREDKTVRPECFIPPPNLELSVTRHRGISEAQLWQIGEQVAQEVQRPLYGRADVLSQVVRDFKLEPVSSPTENNRNHVNIVGWPAKKPEQKSYAQKLAADSAYVPVPQA